MPEKLRLAAIAIDLDLLALSLVQNASKIEAQAGDTCWAGMLRGAPEAL